MAHTNTKILKALDFIETKVNQLEKNPKTGSSSSSSSSSVGQQLLFFLPNEFIFNYLKVSSFYFKEQSFFFFSCNEQTMSSVSLAKLEKQIKGEKMDCFLLTSKNFSLREKEDGFLYDRCQDALATNFSVLLKHVDSGFYCKELEEIEQNNNDLGQLRKNLFSPFWFESFNLLFPTSFKKLKKNVIFLGRLLILRERKVKNLLREIRQKETKNFLGLLRLDQKIFHVLHASHLSLSSLINILHLVKSKRKNEILSHHETRQDQIIQKMFQENKKSWTDSFNPFSKSLQHDKVNRSFIEAGRKLKKEDELLKKLLAEETKKNYGNENEQ